MHIFYLFIGKFGSHNKKCAHAALGKNKIYYYDFLRIWSPITHFYSPYISPYSTSKKSQRALSLADSQKKVKKYKKNEKCVK